MGCKTLQGIRSLHLPFPPHTVLIFHSPLEKPRTQRKSHEEHTAEDAARPDVCAGCLRRSHACKRLRPGEGMREAEVLLLQDILIANNENSKEELLVSVVGSQV